MAGGPVMHTVAPGDNLWAIANRFGTTPAAIAARNGLTDANLIFPGQVLAIPQDGESPVGPAAPASGEGGDWWGLAQEMGAKHGVDPRLVWAVIQAESTGAPLARSGAGAMGLMQLMPDTARWLGVANPWDPRQNVDGGTKFLRMLLDMFKGDVTLAVAGYNAGPGAVQQYGGVPPFEETRLYVRRIREYLALAPVAGAPPAPAPAAEPEGPAGTAPAPASGSYTVQSGDSLYLIAAKVLGDAGLWGRLYDANRDLIGPDPGMIRPGMVLQVPGAAGTVPEAPTEPAPEAPAPAAAEPVAEPVAEPAAEPVAEPVAEPAPEAPAVPATYTVVSGDTLSDIALRTLGSAARWTELYDLNREQIGPDPGMIRVGMVLALPGGAAAPAPAAEPAAPAPAPASDIPGADEALAWQARQLAAGNSYSNWCLAFVNQAYQAAGRRIGELGKPGAADSMDTYRAQGRMQPMDAAPPRGAVVFWDRTPSNQYGHIAISNGDGTISTSGWPGFGGSASISLERLDAMLGRPAIGWAAP